LATETQALKPTTISPPDTSKLPRPDFDAMLAVRVTDEETLQVATNNARACKDYIGRVTDLFKEPVEAANKLHKFLTGLRGQFTARAQEVETHSRAQILAYQTELERKRKELEERLRREAEAKARAEAEARRQEELARARAEQQRIQAEAEKARAAAAKAAAEAVEEVAPWEQEAAAAAAKAKQDAEEALRQKQIADAKAQLEAMAAEPLQVFVPEISVSQTAPFAEGLGLRKGPLTYEVEDLGKLVAAAARNPHLLEYLQVNDAMVKAKLKAVGEKLSDFLPGLKAVRKSGITIR
jgi:DNA repair exonuclease SbcCD ATPase subunit